MKGFCTGRDRAARRDMEILQNLPCECSLQEWYKCRRAQCLKRPPPEKIFGKGGLTPLDAG